MATTGSPIRLLELPDRWDEVATLAGAYFVQLVETQMSPFL
jgi:hypothetical protein